MSVILAIQEAESRRIMVLNQPRQVIHETLSPKIIHKNRAGGVAQSEDPAFKPLSCQKQQKHSSP
jgi:hypothetical protein